MNACEDALNAPVPPAPALPVVTVVACALIDPDNRILIAQRPQGKAMAGLWEFPGGKIERGELPEYALMRELKEELGIESRPQCFTPLAFTSHSYDNFHLLMPLFGLRMWRGVPRAVEHDALKWVRVHDLNEYPMPAADVPLIAALRDLL